MTEVSVDLNPPVQQPQAEPANRSTGALVLFLLMALPMPFCLLIYHFMLWSTEQSAIASGRLANLAWAGLIGLTVQAVLLTALIAALWYFTKDDRFKPVYAGWLGAALMAFPALILRLLGPNNDQLGSILQILICAMAAVIVSKVRQVKIDWRSNHKSFAFF